MWVGASTTSSSAPPCARSSNAHSSAPACSAPTIAPSELKSTYNETKTSSPHATVGTKPCHRVGQRLRRRRLRQAEFPNRFGGVEPHFVLRHAHTGQRRFGRFAGEAVHRFVHVRGGQHYEIRDPHFRRGHAGYFFEHAERLLHR